MLDFLLVLGQIPGTEIQITFYEFILAFALFVTWYYRAQLRRWALGKKQETITYLRLKYWQWRQLSLPL